MVKNRDILNIYKGTMLDKDLTFAEKYNWWSSEKKDISVTTKISYVMTQGKIHELYFVFQEYSLGDLREGFSLIEKDNFALKSSRRRGVIKSFFEEKDAGRL